MKSLLRWTGFATLLLLLAVGCVMAFVLAASQKVIARTYDVPLTTFNAPSDSRSVQKGQRLASIYGCTSCHGKDMQGVLLYDEPGIARISAPNLTSTVKDYTDAELERLLRHGIKHDGTSAWIMPAPMFTHLTEEDLGAIAAYVRSKPDRKGIERETSIGPLGRIGIVTGKFKPIATQVRPDPQRETPDRDNPFSLGRYLVKTACTECHGVALQGSELVRAPNLLVVAAYGEQDFFRLMRTGLGVRNRELGLMTEAGRVRFAALTDAEIHAIYVYLQQFIRGGGSALP